MEKIKAHKVVLCQRSHRYNEEFSGDPKVGNDMGSLD